MVNICIEDRKYYFDDINFKVLVSFLVVKFMVISLKIEKEVVLIL